MKGKLPRRLVLCCLLLCLLILLPALHVRRSAGRYIPELDSLPEADCILVLGCGLEEDGSPSVMLWERINTGVSLYTAGAAPTLLMSGSARPGHDETAAMSAAAIAAGVPESAVLCDGEGHNTSLSFRNLSQAEPGCTVLIVTHRYHLYRAIYLARTLGLNAYGVPSDTVRYLGQLNRDVRELLARDKDFLQCLLWRLRLVDPAE